MVQLYAWGIWYFCATLLFNVCHCQTDPTRLDYDKSGSVCELVSYDGKREASISLFINELYTTDKDHMNDVKIPVLIFHYTHASNFSSLIPIELYDVAYADRIKSDKNILPPTKDNKFDLQLASGYSKIDEDKLLNDYLIKDQDGKDDNERTEIAKHVDLSFSVKESGLYCVYIEPPTDKHLTALDIPVRFTSSHGDLPYLEYVVYSQLKWGILVGVALSAYLFYYILHYKVGKDFKNLNNISLISKGVILYVLVPYVITLFIKQVVFFLRNNFSHTDSPSKILNFFTLGAVYVEMIFNVFLNYVLLIFAMGFGVIYYHGTSKNYRQFPAKAHKVSFRLLVFHIAFITVVSVYTLISGGYFPFSPDSFGTVKPPVANFVVLIQSVLSFIWFILIIVNYFKTKKVLNKFPPVDASTESSSEANAKIIQSFKRSILFVFIFPLVLGLAIGGFFVYEIVQTGVGLGLDAEPTNPLDASVLAMKTFELLVFKNRFISALQWSQFINVYLIVTAIYFFWIRDNNGLVVDKEQQYDEVPRFEISDDESEQL